MFSSLQTRYGMTYFFPRQLRGPNWNGCRTSLTSLLKRESPSHRSGMKSSGEAKFRLEWYEAQCGTDTTV